MQAYAKVCKENKEKWLVVLHINFSLKYQLSKATATAITSLAEPIEVKFGVASY